MELSSYIGLKFAIPILLTGEQDKSKPESKPGKIKQKRTIRLIFRRRAEIPFEKKKLSDCFKRCRMNNGIAT